MRLGIVCGHVTLTPAVPELLGLTLVVLEPVTMASRPACAGTSFSVHFIPRTYVGQFSTYYRAV